MNESLEEVAATCVEKISKFSVKLDGDEDERVEKFYEKIILWLEQIEDQDRIYFIKLLSCFSYFDRIKIKNSLMSLFKKFIGSGANQYQTIYMPITSKDGIKNGADELINIFYRANKVSKDVTPSQISQFYNSHDLDSIKNIVFIDDIIGSGTTIEYFFKYVLDEYPKLIPNKNIYILCLVITDKALSRLTDFCLNNQIKVNFIYEFKQDKAFDPGVVYEDKQQATKAKRTVKKYEERIVEDPIYILGYKNSQLLTAFYYNTPNNTLSTFWMDNEDKGWRALLKRYENDSRYQISKKSSMLQEIIEKDKNKKTSILDITKQSKERG